MYPKPRRIEIKEIIKYFFNFIIQQITKKTFAINRTGTAILTIVKIGTVFGDMKGSRQDNSNSIDEIEFTKTIILCQKLYFTINYFTFF